MAVSVLRTASVKSALGYLSCLRLPEIVVLAGSPVLGFALASHRLGTEQLAQLALLVAANACLVAHIFLANDWSGLTTDLADPNRVDRVFTTLGITRRGMGTLVIVLLAMSLALFSQLGRAPLSLAAAIVALGALYSLPRLNWKSRPILSSALHLVGGSLHFLLGYSVASAIDGRAAAIATFFALTFAAGHLTQEIRDYHGDVRSDIQTNAVFFGPRRTFVASLVLFALAYASLFGLALQGTLPRVLAAVAVLGPLHLRWSLATLAEGLTYASMRRLQLRYRAIYALIGAAMLAASSFRV